MRSTLGLVISSLALPCVACSPILQEVRYPGGYSGYILDKRTFDASRSKDLELLRAALILGMASRMATATIRDGKDADAFADYLAAAVDELNYAAADVYPVGVSAPCALREDAASASPCGAYYAMFESDMPMLESRIVRVVLAALPEDRGRAFLADVSKGNVLAAALTAIKTVYETTGGLHRAAGVYRSGLEIVASSVTCARGDFKASEDTVWAAADCLGLSHEKFNDSPNELKGESLAIHIKKDAFYALMLITRSSCSRLSYATDQPIAEEITKRNSTCERIAFDPKYRLPVEQQHQSASVVAPNEPVPVTDSPLRLESGPGLGPSAAPSASVSNPGEPQAAAAFKFAAKWGSSGDRAQWSTTLLKAIHELGGNLTKPDLIPADIAGYCPKYTRLDEEGRKMVWASLLSALARPESDFNPSAHLVERGILDVEGRRVVSRGLLGISQESANGYGCGITDPRQLHDPLVNLRCGVRILNRLVARDSVVAGGSANHWRGAARYWQPFREASARKEMSDWLRSQPYCALA